MKWWAYPARETLQSRDALLYYVGSAPVRILVAELQRTDSRAV